MPSDPVGPPRPFGPWLLAGVIAFATTAILWQRLAGPQEYPEPIVGALAHAATSKLADTRAFALLVGLTLGLGLVLSKWYTHLDRLGGPGLVGAVDDGCRWAMLPFAVWLGASLVGPFAMPPAICLVSLLAGVGWLAILARSPASADLARTGPLGLLIVALAWLTGVAVTLAVDRLGGRVTSQLPAILAGLAWMTVALIAQGQDRVWRLEAVMLAVQVALPLLFLTLIPASVLVDGERMAAPYRPGLGWLIAGLMLVAWAELVWRGRRWWRGESISPGGLFASAGLIAGLVFMLRQREYLSLLSADYFHSGEQLVPWQQCVGLGCLPYAECVPIHGLMSFLLGGINFLCFGGAAGLTPSHILLGMSAVALTVVTARPVVGVGGAVVAGLVCGLMQHEGDVWNRVMFVPSAVFLLARPGLVNRPANWSATALVLLAVMTAYNFAAGLALLPATTLVGGLVLWRGWIHWRSILAVLGTAAILCVGLLAWPTGRTVTLAFAAFLTENAATNTVSHAIDWRPTAHGPFADGVFACGPLWELRCHGWIVLALVLVGLAKGRKLGSTPHRLTAFLAGSAALCLAPWALGRMDPVVQYRSAAVTGATLAVALPLVCRWRANIGLAVALGLAMFTPSLAQNWRDVSALARSRSVERRPAPIGTAHFDGRHFGMPALGVGLMRHADVHEALMLRQALADWLRPGETYLDWSNRQAFYAHLNLPVPAAYPANFTVSSSTLQRRVLRQLADTRPPVVLVWPRMDFGSPPSLRTPTLVREYVRERGFVPVERDGLGFLVDPVRLTPAERPTPEMRRRLLARWLAPADLEHIPAAWGDSTLIRQSLEPIAGPIEGRVDGSMCVHFDLSPSGLSGNDVDLVELCWQGVGEIPAEVSGQADDGEVGAMCFIGKPGTLLVPMSAHPGWLTADRLQRLTIRWAGEMSVGRSFRVQIVKFYRLRSRR